jgi:hypothetical protein
MLSLTTLAQCSRVIRLPRITSSTSRALLHSAIRNKILDPASDFEVTKSIYLEIPPRGLEIEHGQSYIIPPIVRTNPLVEVTTSLANQIAAFTVPYAEKQEAPMVWVFRSPSQIVELGAQLQQHLQVSDQLTTETGFRTLELLQPQLS